MLNMAAIWNEALPSEQKEPIGKVSKSLIVPLDGPIAIEIVSPLRRALRTVHAHWRV